MYNLGTLCSMITKYFAAEAMAQFPRDICFLKGFFSDWS